MPIVPTSLDYTDLDFDALRVRLFALVKSVFPDWTDEQVSNFGNLLVELYCHVGDVVTFYLDRHANESRIVTASQRRSLIALCKLIAFEVEGAKAATVDVTFSIPAAVAGDVVFPAGTIVRTADVTDSVKFQLLAALTIPAGATSATGTVENSENAVDAFTSTGLADQEVVLGTTPYLDDSAVVVAANGAYTQVDNFLSSTSSDRHFIVVVDQNDRARIRFGNGTLGAIPVGTINVAYKTGGGESGNVSPGALKVLDGSWTDSLGNSVAVTVTNALKASGGANRMSNAVIKSRAPASVRAPVNSIAREDFVINAKRLGSVARALMLTSNEDPSVPENTGKLHIIPVGGGNPSSALKTQVKNQVTVVYPCPLTFQVDVVDPVYKTVNIEATIYLKPGFSGPTVKAAVLAALTSWFAISNPDGSENTNVDFGANYIEADGDEAPAVPWSDVFNVIRDAAGVRKVSAANNGLLLNGLREDCPLAFKEFPLLGTVKLIDGDLGVEL